MRDCVGWFSGAAVPIVADQEDNLTCCLCLELFHNCVAAYPCLHKFCAGCLSEQAKHNRVCPSCRVPIKSAAVDHAMNSIVRLGCVLGDDVGDVAVAVMFGDVGCVEMCCVPDVADMQC